jgi:hypothetical protein
LPLGYHPVLSDSPELGPEACDELGRLVLRHSVATFERREEFTAEAQSQQRNALL